jgi:hypothetical protein
VECQIHTQGLQYLSRALSACFMMDSCLVYFMTLKIEVICSSETSVDIHQTACQSALQPSVGIGLLYNQSPPGVMFLNKIVLYSMGLLAPCPIRILEDQGISLSLDSTL